jgi:hypothetical protein
MSPRVLRILAVAFKSTVGPWGASPPPSAEQGLNTPSQAVAIDTGSGHRRLVWDPSPQSEERKFGRVEDVKGIGPGARSPRWAVPAAWLLSWTEIHPPSYLTLVASV